MKHSRPGAFSRRRPHITSGARARCIAFIAATMISACGTDPSEPAAGDDGALRQRALAAGLMPMPLEPVRPVDNPFIAERVTLGHHLFFDPILSGPRDVACSTCHLPRFAFADGRQFPAGAGAAGLGPDRSEPGPWPLRLMPRNSPALFNVGLYGRFGTQPSTNAMMFWNGGAFGLEDQVLNPIAADNELRGLAYPKFSAVDSVVARLRKSGGYVDAFMTAFPDIGTVYGRDPDRLITASTLRLAIAAYIRELVTPRAPFDAFLAGDDLALKASQKRGLDLFIGKAGCVHCHTGPALSDFSLHVIGVLQQGLGRDTTPGDDLGSGEQGGTRYAFRTAPLRQVALSAPYFHAGTANTLEQVVRFKNEGNSKHPAVNVAMLDPAVRALGLADTEIADVVAFLEALTDSVSVVGSLFQAPASVPSGLLIPK